MDQLSEEVQQEITEAVQDLLEDYIENNALIFSKKNYLDIFVQHISTYIADLAKTEGWYNEYDDEADLDEWIESLTKETFEMVSVPLRESSPYNPFADDDTSSLNPILAHIHRQPVQKQRSIEWYMIRKDLFSASNIWKLFSTEGQYNSLIYEKCKPFDIEKNDYQMDPLVPNARNWGIKYEPLTVMVYEYKNQTHVNTNYGCIPHETLPIGASPDGIVCDETSEKYGRLVEIKNIYNREIDGIPSEEYWIQMQTQMEVCRLDICDFVETRFKEFDNIGEYQSNTEYEFKGIILFFISRNPGEFESQFEYMPIEVCLQDEDHQNAWIEQIKQQKQDTHVIYHTTFWYLDEYSCVEVLRNDVWFSCAKPIIEAGWETVLKERQDGYEHRAPQKKKTTRSPSLDESNTTKQSVCELFDMPNIQNNQVSVGKIQVVKLDTSNP